MSKAVAAECEIAPQVIKVLSDCFSTDHRKIKMGSRLVEDLYVDSINLIEIVMALNDTFGIELPGEGVETCRTVKDICDLVCKVMRLYGLKDCRGLG